MKKSDIIKLFKEMESKDMLVNFGEELIGKEISVVQYKLVDDDFVMSIYDSKGKFSTYTFLNNKQSYYLEKEKINCIEKNIISLNGCYKKYINGEDVDNLVRFGSFLMTDNYDIIANILKKVDIST